jgi:hypothetical protein
MEDIFKTINSHFMQKTAPRTHTIYMERFDEDFIEVQLPIFACKFFIPQEDFSPFKRTESAYYDGDKEKTVWAWSYKAILPNGDILVVDTDEETEHDYEKY